MINQGVKITNVQYYNINQESIISNIITEIDIYNNYSYTSCDYWEIEKLLESHPKKLEFNVNKPEIDLKKIDFNIIVNNDEIDDMNNDKIVYSSDDLANHLYSNINYHNVQQEQTNNDSLYTLADKDYT